MYKLILLDFSMPQMDGPDVAKEIHNMFTNSILLSTGDRPYICCCSAYGQASFVKQAKAAGMDEYLTKPISSDTLKKLCATHFPTNKSAE